MFYLIIIAVMVLFQYLGVIADPTDQNEWIIAGWVISSITLTITFIIQVSKFYVQTKAVETVLEQQQNRKIYVRRAKEYIDEFKVYLAETYPKYEKELFKVIKPENVTAFMIKYPEIKANETIVKLVNTISRLKDSYYECDVKVNELNKEIRLRKRTMFLFCLPILPAYTEQVPVPGDKSVEITAF